MSAVAPARTAQSRAEPAARNGGPRVKRGTPLSRFRASLPWYVMVVPALLLILGFIAYPAIQSVILSFEDVKLGQNNTWIGFDNYAQAFNDPQMWQALGTTLFFSVAAVLIQLILAWVLALLLWGAFRKLGPVLRVLFAIPMMLSPVVVGVVWRVLLNPQFGWIPWLFGGNGLDLLGNTTSALWTMVAVDTWQWTPFLFLIVAAALNSIPDDVLEASRLDGAGSVKLFLNIVWPLTLPVTIIGVLFRSLDALKTFDLPFNLTQGGPGTTTQTIAMYLYRQGFTRYDQGYAAALALIATVLMAAVAIALLAANRAADRRMS